MCTQIIIYAPCQRNNIFINSQLVLLYRYILNTTFSLYLSTLLSISLHSLYKSFTDIILTWASEGVFSAPPGIVYVCCFAGFSWRSREAFHRGRNFQHKAVTRFTTETISKWETLLIYFRTQMSWLWVICDRSDHMYTLSNLLHAISSSYILPLYFFIFPTLTLHVCQCTY